MYRYKGTFVVIYFTKNIYTEQIKHKITYKVVLWRKKKEKEVKFVHAENFNDLIRFNLTN